VVEGQVLVGKTDDAPIIRRDPYLRLESSLDGIGILHKGLLLHSGG
jgi:hypothetical protein